MIRYFLIASITFHAALFVSWPAFDDGNRAGDVPALSLVINKHNDSLRTSLNDRSRQDQPLRRQYDTPAAMEEKRHYIGSELDTGYFDDSNERLFNAKLQTSLF